MRQKPTALAVLSKLRRGRGNEAQTKKNLETPHVVSYGFEIAALAVLAAALLSAGCATHDQSRSSRGDEAPYSLLSEPTNEKSQSLLTSAATVQEGSHHAPKYSNETVFALLLPAVSDARKPVIKNETIAIAIVPVSSDVAPYSFPANQLNHGHLTDE